MSKVTGDIPIGFVHDIPCDPIPQCIIIWITELAYYKLDYSTEHLHCVLLAHNVYFCIKTLIAVVGNYYPALSMIDPSHETGSSANKQPELLKPSTSGTEIGVYCVGTDCWIRRLADLSYIEIADCNPSGRKPSKQVAEKAEFFINPTLKCHTIAIICHKISMGIRVHQTPS